MDNQLATLTTFGRALCEVVLGDGRGSALLPLRLDEAHLHVDSLISEGLCCGALAALTSVSSPYNSVDFEVIGRGHALGGARAMFLPSRVLLPKAWSSYEQDVGG